MKMSAKLKLALANRSYNAENEKSSGNATENDG